MSKNKVRPSVASIDWLDGHSFEYFCADVLKKLGYKDIWVTKASGDNGVDIVAHLNGVSYAVQCKRYSKKVGNKAVQEVFAGRSYYNCARAIVITNNYFTEQAIDTARRLGVTLWDRNFLDQMMRAAYSDSDSAKNAILKSNYQAKSKNEIRKKRSGCAWIIAIILIFLVICAIINGTSSNDEESPTTTTITTTSSTTQQAKKTQPKNGGAVKGFDSLNRLIIDA